MEKDKIVGYLYTTYDYKKFKTILGNRDLKPSTLNKIKKNMKKNGCFGGDAIRVNRKMEIIDGQHRFQAAQDLGLPIVYYFDDDADIEDVRQTNSDRSNWVSKDYVKSHADNGDVDYKYVEQLFKAFPNVSQGFIYKAIGGNNGRVNSAIKDSSLRCDENRYNDAFQYLFWWTNFVDPILDSRNITQKNSFFCALRQLFPLPVFNAETFAQRLKAYPMPIMNYALTKDVIPQIDIIYNYKVSKKNRVDIKSAYESSLPTGTYVRWMQ